MHPLAIEDEQASAARAPAAVCVSSSSDAGARYGTVRGFEGVDGVRKKPLPDPSSQPANSSFPCVALDSTPASTPPLCRVRLSPGGPATSRPSKLRAGRHRLWSLTPRRWMAGRRSRLAQVGAVVLLGVCLLVVAGGLGRGGGVGRAELDELIPSETQGREDDALVDVDKTPAADPYCSVFGDPAECEKQKQDGLHLYWSPLQVRGELWKTMKALAELEMRENGHHSKHKAAAEEQAKVLRLF